MRLLVCCCVALSFLAASVPAALGQTTIGGSSLAFRSSGSSSNGDWTLDENGYVGTYISLPAPGQVTLTVDASGATGDAVNPHMNFVVADTKAPFDVTGGFNDYEHTFDLPAGTFFVRTEFNNDVPAANRELTVRSLTVDGATVSNTGSSSTNNANALAAADTYINNFRKGNVQVGLSGLAPGTTVGVSLKRHAFSFGTAVPGSSTNGVNTYLGDDSDPQSTAFQYQQALAESKFNAIVPENAGKWGSHEGARDSEDLGGVDAILDFAENHNMRARMHNLIWGSQQPGWASTMYNSPGGTDNYNSFFNPQGTNLQNQDALYSDQLAPAGTPSAGEPSELHERIDYYVRDRAHRYYELDVYNESVHTSQYWDVYGAEGIADIYNEVAQAVVGAGADTRLFTNEYNVLQDSGDYYGNWYRQNIEEIRNAGGAVTGIGIQSYENDNIGTSSGAHFPARKMQTLQNLSVLGLPITLTEFGVKDPTDQTDATTMLDDSVRLMFGTPDATGFFMWGFWRGSIFRGAAAFYDNNWNLTLPGQRWQDLLSIDEDGDPNDDWDTQLTAVVGADGTINFDGFWGDYEITIGGQTLGLTLVKGTSAYSLVVAPGDYNGDGRVDAGDYTVWRDTLDSTDDLRADGNGNLVIDDGDYDVWVSLFGAVYGSGASASATVPEPGTLLLLLVGCAAICRRCR